MCAALAERSSITVAKHLPLRLSAFPDPLMPEAWLPLYFGGYLFWNSHL
jgi:hypothetical protein